MAGGRAQHPKSLHNGVSWNEGSDFRVLVRGILSHQFGSSMLGAVLETPKSGLTWMLSRLISGST